MLRFQCFKTVPRLKDLTLGTVFRVMRALLLKLHTHKFLILNVTAQIGFIAFIALCWQRNFFVCLLLGQIFQQHPYPNIIYKMFFQ